MILSRTRRIIYTDKPDIGHSFRFGSLRGESNIVALLLRLVFLRWARPALLGLGLLLVTAGVILTATVSRSVVVVVEEDISRFWRTTYDILVRPPGVRNPVEEKYGLVEADLTSGLRGGISFEQYQAIREIPDVEVAAPITVLGYILVQIDPTRQTPPSSPGVYFLEHSLVVDEGAHRWEDSDRRPSCGTTRTAGLSRPRRFGRR